MGKLLDVSVPVENKLHNLSVVAKTHGDKKASLTDIPAIISTLLDHIAANLIARFCFWSPM